MGEEVYGSNGKLLVRADGTLAFGYGRRESEEFGSIKNWLEGRREPKTTTVEEERDIRRAELKAQTEASRNATPRITRVEDAPRNRFGGIDGKPVALRGASADDDRAMVSRYNSQCEKCGNWMDAGSDIIYNTTRRKARHAACPQVAAAAPVAATTTLDISGIPAGRYAVENADGAVTFLLVDQVEEGKWAGWSFVKQVIGGRDPERRGAQKPGGLYRGTFGSLLEKIAADPREAGIRYGLLLGECSRCGRELTDAASRAAGVGPVCQKAAGW